MQNELVSVIGAFVLFFALFLFGNNELLGLYTIIMLAWIAYLAYKCENNLLYSLLSIGLFVLFIVGSILFPVIGIILLLIWIYSAVWFGLNANKPEETI
jgi:hypothetical protein